MATLINVSLTVSPIKDGTGRIVGASKIARDITRQKRAEDLIREQAHVLALLDTTGRIDRLATRPAECPADGDRHRHNN